LSVVTETFMERTPLEAADLHQMLVSRGATLTSTLMQRQADFLEVAVCYGVGAILRGSAAGFDSLEMAKNKIYSPKSTLRRDWRGSLRLVVWRGREAGALQSEYETLPRPPVFFTSFR
jgi:hypothetical protein